MKLVLKHISRISGIFVLSFGILVVLVGLWLWFSLPPISTLKAEYPHLVVVENDGFPRVIFKKLKPLTWVHVSEVSKPAIGAIIVSEDWAFYQHPGYDLNQIQDALEESLKRRHLVRGASTITQQVLLKSNK
ncbi:MAG: transglycosylase domain-containing protein [Deltaproteobacteria bacterium]|nr:transglycosylase domain-containing protein [Deltaproteobacteria bacterium]